MKKRSIKVTMIVLVLLLSLSMVLSGCSTDKKDDTKDDTKAGTEVSSDGVETKGEDVVEADSGKIDGVMYAEGLPIVDKGDYTFSLFVDDSNATGEFFMLSQFEEQTGISVDLQYFPYEIATEKYGLALSSGDYADCIGGWTLTENDILTYGVQYGTFVPLEDYFEKYCPNITAILNLEGVREAMTAPDGHIYSIPYVLESPLVDFNPYINTRWLKNVGLEVPTTTEELRVVLQAFKDQDANGNGDATDEIPFSFDPDNKHLGYLAGWFGTSVDDNGFTMVGDKLTFGADTEEFKNSINYMNSLYEEGLLDPEMFTQDKSQWKAKGAQDIYGVAMMYGSGDIMPYNAGETPDWVPLPVLSSEGIDKPVYLKSSYGSMILKYQVVITDNAENPAAICRWWDNVMALENSIQVNAGPLGTTVFEEEGQYRTIDISTLTEEEQTKYNWGNLWPQSLPKFMPNGFRFKQDVPVFEEKPVVADVYAPYLTEAIIPTFWASAEDATKISDLQTSIKDYMSQKIAEWIAGQSDVNEDWDGYLKQLDKLNLQEFIDIREKAITQ